jgi:putative ABC transport system permease protein
LQDLRFAQRRLVKDRWFTVAAVVALALGIGANSAVFTLVNAVLLRGLPFDQPERIMWIDTHDARGRNFGVSVDDYVDWRAATRTFAGMALVQSGQPNLSGDGRLPEAYPGGYITANAFDLIGVKPILGRGFVGADDAPNAPPVVLFQTGSADPLTLASITILLIMVAISACLWPAWQATRLNPVAALRYE